MPGAKSPAMMSQILPLVGDLVRDPRGWVVPYFGVGGAAIALHEAGARVEWAGDANPILVAILRGLRASPESFVRLAEEEARPLRGADATAQRTWYAGAREELRTQQAEDDIDPVLAYLVWRMGVKGLLRFNGSGAFNTPVGVSAAGGPEKPKGSIFEPGALRAWGEALGRLPAVELASYERTPAEGVLYEDPPYVGTFARYTPQVFDFGAAHAWRSARGGAWVASNSPEAIQAYPWAYAGYEIYHLHRPHDFRGRKGGAAQGAGEILAIRRG